MRSSHFPLLLALTAACQEEEDPHCCWTDLSIGAHHTCGLRPTGVVECWGDPLAIGEGTFEAESGTFVSLTGDSATGTCALSSAGDLRCWGDEDFMGLTEGLERGGISVVSARGDISGNVHSCFDGPDLPFTHWMNGSVTEGWTCPFDLPSPGCPPVEDSTWEPAAANCWGDHRGDHRAQGTLVAADGAVWTIATGSWSVAGEEYVGTRGGKVEAYAPVPHSAGDCEGNGTALVEIESTAVGEVGIVEDEQGAEWVHALVLDGEPVRMLIGGHPDAGSILGSNLGHLCISPEYFRDPFRHRSGYIDVAGAAIEACYLHESGDIDCFSSRFRRQHDAYEGRTMVAIYGGGHTFCAMDDEGGIACFGSNEWGQLDVP